MALDPVALDLEAVLLAWRTMGNSDTDSADIDADRFQAAFYRLIDSVRAWVAKLEHQPVDVDAARDLPDFRKLFDAMPGPLLIPFETELELILSGDEPEVDSTEQ